GIQFDNSNSYTLAGPGSLILDNAGSAGRIEVLTGHHTIAAPIVLADAASIDIAPKALLSVQRLRGKSLSITNGLVQIIPNGGNDGTSDLTGITISVGAALDLSDNDLIIRQGDLAAITAMIASGRNHGTWDGEGIRSSAAAVTPNTGMAVAVSQQS